MNYKIQVEVMILRRMKKLSRYWKAFSERDPNNCLLSKIKFQLQNWTLFETIWDHYRLKYTEIQSNKWISHYVQQWSIILRLLPLFDFYIIWDHFEHFYLLIFWSGMMYLSGIQTQLVWNYIPNLFIRQHSRSWY